jgi:hypothetical protein
MKTSKPESLGEMIRFSFFCFGWVISILLIAVFFAGVVTLFTSCSRSQIEDTGDYAGLKHIVDSHTLDVFSFTHEGVEYLLVRHPNGVAITKHK